MGGLSILLVIKDDPTTYLKLHSSMSFFRYIRIFIKECPSGLMTLHEFQRHFCSGTVGQESAEYAEQIFRTLDCNRVRE